jgi:YfiH family protein
VDGNVSGAATAGALPAIREVRRGEDAVGGALYRNEEWESAHGGLVAGITGAGPGADYGLTTTPHPWALAERLEALSGRLGMPVVVMVRQVHGRRIIPIGSAPPPGLLLTGEGDGLVCRERGVLLVVTAADCVPVYLLDPATGSIALLHAGWKGAAGGVLEAGIEALSREAGSRREELWLHMGPAICGRCYEVGPDVLRAFGLPEEESAHLDIRRELGRRARAAGISAERMSASPWCTRCSGDQFHSHRGMRGRAGRMAAFLGWRLSEG